MTISEEEASGIKQHLLSQLNNFPEEKRSQISEQINAMDSEQIEKFIKQNQLTHLGEQCIFCSIIANKTPSYKIGEDKNYIAILEINPISRGHSLIIPKEHIAKIPESAKLIIEKIKNKIQNKFSPEKIEINEIKIMDHALIEIVPIYGTETERKRATEKELKSTQEDLLRVEEKTIQEKTKKVEEEIPILPPRIP